jgi:hypothetical protein
MARKPVTGRGRRRWAARPAANRSPALSSRPADRNSWRYALAETQNWHFRRAASGHNIDSHLLGPPAVEIASGLAVRAET